MYDCSSHFIKKTKNQKECDISSCHSEEESHCSDKYDHDKKEKEKEKKEAMEKKIK